MKNSTILYYIALVSFIASLIFSEIEFYPHSIPLITIRISDILLGLSLGCVTANLLINFRKQLKENKNDK